MTIDEAIAQLKRIEWPKEYGDDPGITPAIKLGIEALKVWKAIGERYPRIASQFLPGETDQ